MYTDCQVQDYLDRIGFNQQVKLDQPTLDNLVLRHQCAVPFETVTLHRGSEAPSLDARDIFEKIVTHRLGGYCFELNKGFYELLVALGFKAYPCLCRAVRGRDVVMPINHRGTIVCLEGDAFSADVGFGGPMPAGALRLATDLEQQVCGETYITQRVDHAWWNINRITRPAQGFYDDGVPERCQTELALCTAPVEEVDFDALNRYCAQPGTLFRDHEIVNLRTDGGYYGLKDGVFTKRIGSQKEVVQLGDKQAVDQVLAEVFGMEYGVKHM